VALCTQEHFPAASDDAISSGSVDVGSGGRGYGLSPHLMSRLQHALPALACGISPLTFALLLIVTSLILLGAQCSIPLPTSFLGSALHSHIICVRHATLVGV